MCADLLKFVLLVVIVNCNNFANVKGILQDCAFLSPTPSYSSKWRKECYQHNVTIKTTDKTVTVGDVFQDCFTDRDNNNVTHFDVTVREGCSLKLNFNQTVLSGRKQKITVANISSLTVASCQCGHPLAKFDNVSELALVGIIFSPYDKYPEKCSDQDTEKSCLSPLRKKHVNWWNYTKQEIRKQLELVAEEFMEISTYGIGTIQKSVNPPTYNTDWRDGLPVGMVPYTVAEMNKDFGYHRLKIIIGAYSHEGYDPSQFQAEVGNALGAAQDAETLFPGTISGISIHLNALAIDKGQIDLDLVQKMMILARNYSSNGGGKVGIRLQECEQAFHELYNRTEESGRLYCKPSDKNCTSLNPFQLNPLLEPIIKSANFVICFVRPQPNHLIRADHLTKTKMPDIVRRIGQNVLEMKKALEKVNPNLELFLETGWPSQGRSQNGAPNSLRNSRDYWFGMVELAKSMGLGILFFEAFDEPWKKDLTLQGRNESGGICGSEDRYGWWRRKDNSDPGVYMKKFEEDLLGGPDDGRNSTIEPGVFPEDCPLDTPETPPGGRMLLFAIIIAALVFIFLVFGLGYLAFRLKVVKTNSNSQLSQKYLEIFRQGMDSKSAKTMLEKNDGDDYQIIALQFPYDKRKYELDKGSFKIDLSKSLGKGQSGTVYLGEVYKSLDGNGYFGPVAFKSSDSSSSILDIKNFLSEIKIMSYIGLHENIICLIGAYTEKLERGIVHLALEYCPLGSLDKFLQGNGKFKSGVNNSMNGKDEMVGGSEQLNYVTTACLNSSNSSSSSSSCHSSGGDENIIEFDFSTMVKWSWQIANGMEHLANKKVVHADLACRNILLTKDMSIKITDFGLSRKFYSEIQPNLVFDSDVALPWRWMAPESLRKLTFSTSSDVYSFATTCWEIFSIGNVPYAGVIFCSQFVQDLEDGKRLDEPRLATDEILDLMDECWVTNPSDRPTFTRLKELLGQLL